MLCALHALFHSVILGFVVCLVGQVDIRLTFGLIVNSRDPRLRPTFAEIMAALKPLQKPITGAQALRPSSSTRGGHEKGQQSREAE